MNFSFQIYWKILSLLVLTSLLFTSCKKDLVTSEVFVDRRWNVPMSSTNIAGSTVPELQDAQSLFTLMSDKKLYFDIYFTTIKEGRKPLSIQIKKGNTGILEISNFSWANKSLKGDIVLSDEQIALLVSEEETITATISSEDFSDGFVAGQLYLKK